MTAPTSLTIRCPDDWHVHFRDGPMLQAVAPFTAAAFRRAIIMPNLVPPVTSVEDARSYRQRIEDALGGSPAFTPLMTCYMTDTIDPAEIERGHDEGVWVAAKLYPAHATTNSAFGVTSIDAIEKPLATMERIGMPLLVHGEVTDPEVDIFDREAVFIERVLSEILHRHPALRVVMEHVTTEDGIAFVRDNSRRMGATITPHHLMLNRNALFAGGLRPHHYCLPVVKREKHRLALRKAATSGEGPFFLGTDTAPHLATDKESACGCAGVFNGPGAVEHYAQVFEEEDALDRLEAFASLNGPRFYGLEPNAESLVLTREARQLPERVDVEGHGAVVIFRGGETVAWTARRPDAAAKA